MGGSSSSTKLTTLLQTLKNEHCSSTHFIWSSINLSEFSNLEFCHNDINDLIIIQNSQPDNFSELIKTTVSIFTNYSSIIMTGIILPYWTLYVYC